MKDDKENIRTVIYSREGAEFKIKGKASQKMCSDNVSKFKSVVYSNLFTFIDNFTNWQEAPGSNLTTMNSLKLFCTNLTFSKRLLNNEQ